MNVQLNIVTKQGIGYTLTVHTQKATTEEYAMEMSDRLGQSGSKYMFFRLTDGANMVLKADEILSFRVDVEQPSGTAKETVN